MSDIYISVIVPFKNAEKYLRRCLSSILNQNFNNYEIILINDASTDNSFNVAFSIIRNKNSAFIKVINNEKNIGVSASRNIGISNSSGKYLLFVDADDYIEPGLFHYFQEINEKVNLDMFIFNHRLFYSDNKLNPSKFNYTDKFYKINNAVMGLLLRGLLSTAVWDKFIKREILISNNIRFNEELRIGEDVLFILESVFYSKRIFVTNNVYYNYYQNEASAMHTITSKYFDVIKINNLMKPHILSCLNASHFKEYEYFSAYLYLRTIHPLILNNISHSDELIKLLKNYIIQKKVQVNLNKILSSKFSSFAVKAEIFFLLKINLHLTIKIYKVMLSLHDINTRHFKQ